MQFEKTLTVSKAQPQQKYLVAVITFSLIWWLYAAVQAASGQLKLLCQNEHRKKHCSTDSLSSTTTAAVPVGCNVILNHLVGYMQ